MPHEAEASSSKQAMEALAVPAATSTDSLPTFASMSHLLSPPILVALSTLRFSHPTPVQAQVLPLALSGHDIVARARTGSGKTLAYALPVVQKVIKAKEAEGKASSQYQRTRALILVPTRELAEQVTSHVARICQGSGQDVRVANIARDASASVHSLALADRPDIVVATPSSALKALQQTKSLHLDALDSLVLDEADLLLSYGHDGAVRSLFSLNVLPKSYQSYLMSATMSQDVEELRDLLAKGGSRKAQVLNLQDPTHHAHLRQYYVHLSEESKFLLVYVLLRLKLVRGKVLIFVNDVDRGYKVKLFLEVFGVKSCVLNAEMPANSRYHVVQEFNKGVYDVVIATDEASSGLGTSDEDLMEPAKEAEEEGEDENEAEEEEQGAKGEANEDDDGEAGEASSTGKRKRDDAKEETTKKSKKDTSSSSKKKKGKPSSSSAPEYGVSRGIDFISVSCVINFDLPTSLSSYIHRIGRTARGHSTGIALSFVVPSHLAGKRVQGGAVEASSSHSHSTPTAGLTAIKGLQSPTAPLDARVWRKISRHMSRSRADVRPWLVHWPTVEGFRYRVEDALRASTTRVKVREARKAEVAREMLRSERLKGWWEDNPRDEQFLRHDVVAAQKGGAAAGAGGGPGRHLKHVPTYLLPAGGRGALQERGEELRAPKLSEVDGEEGSSKKTRVSYDEHGRSLGYVGMRKQQRGGAGGGARGGRGRGRGRGGAAGGGGGGGGRKKDPLRVGGAAKKK